MTNFKMCLEYDGRAFVGWQRQGRGRSVQGTLEGALSKVCDHPVSLNGSGRTDAGVHARGQTANFKTDSGRSPLQILKGGNCLLPPEVVILSVEEVSDDFHARFSAVGKIYDYDYLVSSTRRPLLADRAWWVGPDLDWAAVEAALPHLAGEHDFAAFRSLGSETRSTVRRIKAVDLFKPEPDLVRLRVEGSGFLRHMVRAIAGTLWQIGRGKVEAGQLAEIIASKDRSKAGEAAPAGGLYLLRVLY